MNISYGCGTWPIALKEEHKLKALEKMELNRIFGFKKYKIAGRFRTLNTVKLSNLHSHSQMAV
jgi:hypothetical protein